MVIPRSHKSLLSNSTSQQLNLPHIVNEITVDSHNSEIQQIIRQHDKCFNGVGKLKDYKLHQYIDRDVQLKLNPCTIYLSIFLYRVPSSESIIHRCAGALRLQCLCHAAPPTVVGGAHNSPIANATILKSWLVHYRLHLYNPSGVFTSPGIDTWVYSFKYTQLVYCSHEMI